MGSIAGRPGGEGFQWARGSLATARLAVGEDRLGGRQRSGEPPCWLGFSHEPHDPCPHPLQANETFAFVGNVTHYAQVWLNISAEIRSFLEQGRLRQHLHWLQQVLGAPGGSGGGARVLGHPPSPSFLPSM